MPARNEAWVVGLSARVALLWCDELVILNHNSVDATVDILDELQFEFPGRAHVVSVPGEQWTEMEHRQFMLELARAKGATHIAIVDADEILTGNLVQFVFQSARCLRPAQILQLPGFNLRGGIDRFHLNGIWGQRWFSTAFRDDDRLHWAKVVRGSVQEEHHQREPLGMPLHRHRPIAQNGGGVMHLWGANERRLIAKHAWYKVTEAIKYPAKPRADIDSMYSLAIKGSAHDLPKNWSYQKVPSEWWTPYAHLMKYLDIDAVPWQEREVWRLTAAHPAETFRGLDLFGVI